MVKKCLRSSLSFLMTLWSRKQHTGDGFELLHYFFPMMYLKVLTDAQKKESVVVPSRLKNKVTSAIPTSKGTSRLLVFIDKAVKYDFSKHILEQLETTWKPKNVAFSLKQSVGLLKTFRLVCFFITQYPFISVLSPSSFLLFSNLKFLVILLRYWTF